MGRALYKKESRQHLTPNTLMCWTHRKANTEDGEYKLFAFLFLTVEAKSFCYVFKTLMHCSFHSIYNKWSTSKPSLKIVALFVLIFPLRMMQHRSARWRNSGWAIPSAWIICVDSLKFDQTFESLIFYLTFTHQTSSDVLNGLLDVHAWPVTQHVTDTSGTVDEPDVIFTSLWHGVETESEMKKVTGSAVLETTGNKLNKVIYTLYLVIFVIIVYGLVQNQLEI